MMLKFAAYIEIEYNMSNFYVLLFIYVYDILLFNVNNLIMSWDELITLPLIIDLDSNRKIDSKSVLNQII